MATDTEAADEKTDPNSWETAKQACVREIGRLRALARSAAETNAHSIEVLRLHEDLTPLVDEILESNGKWPAVGAAILWNLHAALLKVSTAWAVLCSPTPFTSHTLHLTYEAADELRRAFDRILMPIVRATSLYEVQKRTAEREKEATAAAEQLATLVAAAKDLQRDATVASQAAHFDAMSSHHSRLAHRWLVGVIAVGVTLIAAAVWSVASASAALAKGAPAVALGSYLVVTLLASKAIVGAVLYYAFVITLKNYRAHRHLAVCYAQKANALRTFKAFVEAAREHEATKNAVLLAATNAIFTIVPSGYAADQPDPGAGPVVDLARALKGGASGTG